MDGGRVMVRIVVALVCVALGSCGRSTLLLPGHPDTSDVEVAKWDVSAAGVNDLGQTLDHFLDGGLAPDTTSLRDEVAPQVPGSEDTPGDRPDPSEVRDDGDVLVPADDSGIGECLGPDDAASWDDADLASDPSAPKDPLPEEVLEHPGAGTDAPQPPHLLRLRIVAANLTSGNNQSYDPGHGIAIMRALKGDVYLVQEFNYGSNGAADRQAMADAVCGEHCDWHVGKGRIPNGIISRWPIILAGAWEDPTVSDRDLTWALIDLPGSKDLFAISVHLHTSPASDQVQAAKVVAKNVLQHQQTHPGCCYYVVGGDFNGTAAVSDNGFGQYASVPLFDVKPPHPADPFGNPNTNANRTKQLDFVLLGVGLRPFQVAVTYEAKGYGPALVYPDGLVFDSRCYSQLQLDIYFPGVHVSDSAAPNMQHMAVVKDVEVPVIE